jgi:tetratricopeptide (TPR) repeat protein
VVASLLALLLLASPKESAVAAFKAGQASYAAGDYAAALKEFQDAYFLLPSDELLYDIGLCHRHLKEWALARTCFRHYLLNPAGPHHAQAVGYFAEASAELGLPPDLPPAAPSQPPPAAPAPAPPAILVLPPAPPPPAARAPSAATEAQAEPKPKPAHRGHAAGYVLGGFAVAGVAGAVVGFGNVAWFNSSYNKNPTPGSNYQATYNRAINWGIAGWASTAVALTCGTLAAVEW